MADPTDLTSEAAEGLRQVVGAVMQEHRGYEEWVGYPIAACTCGEPFGVEHVAAAIADALDVHLRPILEAVAAPTGYERVPERCWNGSTHDCEQHYRRVAAPTEDAPEKGVMRFTFDGPDGAAKVTYFGRPGIPPTEDATAARLAEAERLLRDLLDESSCRTCCARAAAFLAGGEA